MPNYIYYDNCLVAVIGEEGQINFDDEGIERAGMPNQWIPHIRRLLESSLPEGLRRDTLLRLVSRSWAGPGSAIELVPYVADLPGRFSVGDSPPPGKNEEGLRKFLPVPAGISDMRIESWIPKTFFDPLSEPRVNSKPSFSGYQDKFTANLKVDGDRLILSLANQERERGNVIVKPAHPKYPFIAENEYLCMELARRAGFSAPRVFMFQQDGLMPRQRHLLVERFDVRAVGGAAQVLNVSEFAPLMDLSSAQKYDPTTEQIFDFAKSILPPESLKIFAGVYLFGCAVHNGDMHAKNFSVVFEEGGGYLSPIYDMLNTEVYGDGSALALTLAGENSPASENIVNFMLNYLTPDEIEATARSVRGNLGECAQMAFMETDQESCRKFRKRLEQSIAGVSGKILRALRKIRK